jgi:amino acid adenylation domain-containing protein
MHFRCGGVGGRRGPAVTVMSQRISQSLADLPVDPAGITALTNPVDFGPTGTVIDHVDAHATSQPDRTAVIAGDSVLSYGQLVRRVEEYRDVLRAHGCAVGDIVACLGHRTADTVVLFLALESIGAVYLPVDPGWPPARIAEVLELSGSAIVFDYRDTGTPRIEARADRDARLPESAESPPRYVIYTSGTTGRPKGAIVAEAGMLNHLLAKIADLALTARDRVACTAPLVFDISIWQLLAPLVVGATVVVVPDGDIVFPRRLYRQLARHEVSVVELVPTAIAGLLDETARQAADRSLPALRWLISTGEELKPVLAHRVLFALPHARLLNAYGPTECSDDVTHHVVTDADTTRTRLPVGRPIANAAIYCLTRGADARTWTAPEPGAAGEIFVGGVPAGLGYLGDPDATRAAFFRDPFDPDSPTRRLYRTGDLGRIENGVVHYLGRVDRQVKVAGVRMELDEIEAALSRHPAVGQCAVTLAGGNGRPPHLTAHYVPAAPVAAAELEAFLAAVLPASQVPRHWAELDALPLTANGKVDHRTLVNRAATD